MTKNELEILALLIINREDLAEVIMDAHDQATDDENGESIAADSLISDYEEINDLDLSHEDRYDLEEIICEMIINGESAND